MALSLLSARLSELRVGESHRQPGLEIYPLLGPDRPGPDYLTADEALAAGVLTVEEIGREGVVAGMVVTNRGDKPVLILDGEMLQGSKQNRVLNTTVLIAAGSTTRIPVSCVEQGRWHQQGCPAKSDHVSPGDLRHALKKSVTRSLKKTSEHSSDQGNLWHLIKKKLEMMGSVSPTSDLARAYEDHEPELEQWDHRIEPAADWQGVVMVTRGRITAGELFDRSGTLRKVFPKLLRAAVVDVKTRRRREERDTADAAQVRSFLDRVSTASIDSFPSPGIGEDLRIDDGDLAAAALVAEEAVVHAGVLMAE